MAGSGRLIDYLGEGTFASRPASLTLVTGGLGIYWATDTNVVYLWNGSAWLTLPAVPGSAAWGAITGTLSAQTDLQTALNGKLSTSGTAAAASALSPGSKINGTTYLGSADIVAPYFPVTALSISSGVVNINCALGNYFTLSLTANVTSITFTNIAASGFGQTIMVRMQQDATGSRTVALPSSFKPTAGSDIAVQSAANAWTILAITTFDQGTRWEYSMQAGGT